MSLDAGGCWLPLTALRSAGLLHHPQYAGHHRGESLSIEAMARSDRDSALGSHRLNVDKPSDTVPPLASSETGVLHPAHRRVDAAEGGGKALVDVHGATFDLACHAASAIMVGGPHTRVETIVGVVGSCHRVLLGGNGIDADDRTEGLLGVTVHLPA